MESEPNFFCKIVALEVPKYLRWLKQFESQFWDTPGDFVHPMPLFLRGPRSVGSHTDSLDSVCIPNGRGTLYKSSCVLFACEGLDSSMFFPEHFPGDDWLDDWWCWRWWRHDVLEDHQLEVLRPRCLAGCKIFHFGIDMDRWLSLTIRSDPFNLVMWLMN